jgi:hypothetical protein
MLFTKTDIWAEFIYIEGEEKTQTLPKERI